MRQQIRARNAQTQAPAVEHHSIGRIPSNERFGRPHNQFTFWFAPNLAPGTVATGAALGLAGLPLAWTLVAIVLGHTMGGVTMALHSAQGPRLGIPQMIQSRAQFGYRGAVVPIVAVILMYLGYLALSLVLVGGTLSDLTGVNSRASIVVAAVIAALLAIYGYRVLHLLTKILAAVVGLTMLILTIGFFVRNDLSSSFTGGSFTWATFLLATGVAAGWQLTYGPYVADYSRYLPESTSIRSTFCYTFAGSVLSSSWMFALGAFGASVVADGFLGGSTRFLAGQAGFGTEVFLLILFFGLLPSCAVAAYGSFMSLTTIVTTWRGGSEVTRTTRVVTMSGVTALGAVVALAGQGDFLNNLLAFISLLLFLLVPWSAINLVDFYLVRRERYDIKSIYDSNGIYGGFDWRALGTYFVCLLLELPFLGTTLYTGPFVEPLGGADLSWIVGIVSATVLYYAVMRLWPVRRGVSAFDRSHNPGDAMGEIVSVASTP